MPGSNSIEDTHGSSSVISRDYQYLKQSNNEREEESYQVSFLPDYLGTNTPRKVREVQKTPVANDKPLDGSLPFANEHLRRTLKLVSLLFLPQRDLSLIRSFCCLLRTNRHLKTARISLRASA